MKIIITTEGTEVLTETQPTNEGEQATLPDVAACFMSSLEAMCSMVMDTAEEAEIQELHDYMTALFSLFMEKVFPGRAEFGLSDAALIKAQDDILRDAISKGRPIEEAIEEYNKVADEYIQDIKDARKMS